MKYYIVLTYPTAERLKKEYLTPRKVPKSDLNLLSQKLNASFIKQEPCPVKPIDSALARLSGTLDNWAFARYIASQLSSDDVVFCPGEEIGIPLSSVCNTKKAKPKIIVWLHRITGLRTRIALKLFDIAHAVDSIVVSSRSNKEFIEKYLNFPSDRLFFGKHPIDCSYFTPGTASLNKTRPIIASVGLEQRDYRLLAAATENLDVEVKIAGFSQFQTRIAKSFPKVMPKNMTNKRYQWSDLIQLYHDADVVVIPLKENRGAAGITVLLEAMACKKPIVCVRTKGLADYLADEKAIMTVKPGDAASLQKAILYLLNNPEEAKSRVERAYQLVLERHSLEKQVSLLAEFIRSVE